jgi:hypothetical protein
MIVAKFGFVFFQLNTYKDGKSTRRQERGEKRTC